MSTANRICLVCQTQFNPAHWNQSLCSDGCRLTARRQSRSKYKNTDKGSATEQRWRKNPEKKRIDKASSSRPAGRANAVKRATRYLRIHKHVHIRKMQSDRLYSQSDRGKERARLAHAARRERRRSGIPPRPMATPIRLAEDESFSAAEWNEKLKEFNQQCPSCGATGKLTVDHIVPLSVGGSNTIQNVQPLCGSCNVKKRTKTIAYMPWNGLRQRTINGQIDSQVSPQTTVWGRDQS